MVYFTATHELFFCEFLRVCVCATSHAFESAFVNLQIQASLPVSSAVGGKFIHGGKIYMSPSYF